MNIHNRKTILKLAYSLFLIGQLCPESGHTMESPSQVRTNKLQSDKNLAVQHFKEDSLLITQYLNTLDESELHFFWTTGRTMHNSSINKYGANMKVDIGGSDYGQKFFLYIDSLLDNSPKKLKIKFVCDDMTEDSNKEQLQNLMTLYGDRFEVLDIHDVVCTLKRKIAVPSNAYNAIKDNIDLIFKNATQGNPVLASDIYRVVGMVYGHQMPQNIDRVQYTYCDVDAFCHGMEDPNHKDLITALFKPNMKKPFYLGKTERNNDLIKLNIQDLNAYQKFSRDILERASRGTYSYVLTYFSKLHDIIKDCETSLKGNCMAEFAKLEPLTNTLQFMKQIMNATGPYFLIGEYVVNDLEYPSICAGSWLAPDDILIVTGGFSDKNYDSLYWGDYAYDKNVVQKRTSFTNECQDYRKGLSAAYYAKEFGDKHPFNLKLKELLISTYPYNTVQFKNLLNSNYDMQKEKKLYEKWKIETLKDLNANPDDDRYKNHCQKILQLLKNLGIDIGITTNDIVKIEQHEGKGPEVKKTEIIISPIDQRTIKPMSPQIQPVIMPEVISKKPNTPQEDQSELIGLLLKTIDDQATEIKRLNEMLKCLQQQGGKS